MYGPRSFLFGNAAVASLPIKDTVIGLFFCHGMELIERCKVRVPNYVACPPVLAASQGARALGCRHKNKTSLADDFPALWPLVGDRDPDLWQTPVKQNKGADSESRGPKLCGGFLLGYTFAGTVGARHQVWVLSHLSSL
ncbi:unnamed protein product, partial [Iphiclides podalirius]